MLTRVDGPVKTERLEVRAYSGDEVVASFHVEVERDGFAWYRVGGPRKVVLENRTDEFVSVTRVALEAPRDIRALKPDVTLPISCSTIPPRSRFGGKWGYSTATVVLPEKLCTFS